MPLPFPRAISKAGSTALRTIKVFSTTSSRPVTKIPPESPAYITVPKPPLNQSDEIDNKPSPLDYKGHLPIPRRIFKQRNNAIPRTDPEFLKKSAPLPSNEKSQQEPRHEYEAWKRRMAASRRKNLEEGIKELWVRKTKTESQKKAHDTAKTRHFQAARDAPQREDERLTETTVPATLLQTAVPPDPLRFKKQLKSRKRTQKIIQSKSQTRKEALQHLYMNARDFIVDEEVLNQEIEKLFRPDFFSQKTEYGFAAENAWDLDGPPLSVREMMSGITGNNNKAVAGSSTAEMATQKRQKTIAEELTGGPLESNP